ncbi:MAG: sulfurtransferase-like selenium metabolism protein YedF [Desulfarculaceae bacterium]|nr:sulfurtransferase-like selenium metabolism protein YedF [Desulfarculaceae bacterium]MCF8070892.1 sulfurtransferase-like selenium metabolism protein YedF [Desulfarculaceae bacterium]MCF8100480.1 sulfurtransferase-like selenium metabolism protein YedF [Desulfarculaceae bacterium]MCF8118087.1 sulfurtransferase-like selenium metabolism protein YedF [Desulfarculaceae bacterium]
MLDCKGLACPQPVIRTKELIENEAPDTIEVLVDNEAASQNVSRFMGTQGYEASVSPQGGDWLISGRRNPDKVAQDVPPEVFTCSTEDARMLVFVRSDSMGRGDDKLGAGLMKNFLLTLKEMGPSLWRIIFVNAGVRLCCEGSESLEPLKELENSGVSILVCGTCLDFFKLLEQKQVGETTNMLDVVTSLQVAGKVITV